VNEALSTRFLFYNRVATENHQDPEQLSLCRALLESLIARDFGAGGVTCFEPDGRESPYSRPSPPTRTSSGEDIP
jgi:hypothetical protein